MHYEIRTFTFYIDHYFTLPENSLTLIPLRSRTKLPTLALDWDLSGKLELFFVFLIFFKGLFGWCRSNSYRIKSEY